MVKERISLTLDQEVVERIDRRLEQKGISNRSRGIEQLLKEYLKKEAVNDAVILAGGEDSNSLIPINGRPVLEHILDHLEEAGVGTAYVATSDSRINDELNTNREISVHIIVEDEPAGTAGALRYVKEHVNETFLVMNGDVLCTPDLEDMKKAHEESGGLATMALTTVGDSSNYGVIRMKGNQIVGFKEKPDTSFSHLINAGMYLLEPEFLERVPDAAEKQVVDIEAIFEQLAEEGQLSGYVYEGEWREVGP